MNKRGPESTEPSLQKIVKTQEQAVTDSSRVSMLKQDRRLARKRLLATQICDPKVTLAFRTRANPFSSPLIGRATYENEDKLSRLGRATCLISTRICPSEPTPHSGVPTPRGFIMPIEITKESREKVTVRAANMRRHRPRRPTCSPFRVAPLLLLAFVFPVAHCSAPSTLESPVPIKSPREAQLFPNSVSINSLSNPAEVTSPIDVSHLPLAEPYEREQELQSETTTAAVAANKHHVITTTANKQNEGPADYPFSARQLSSHSTRHAPLNQHQQLHYLFPPVSSPLSSRLASRTKHSVQDHLSQDSARGNVFLATADSGTTFTTISTRAGSKGKELVGGSGTVDNGTGGDADADHDDGNQSANQSNPAGPGCSGIGQSYGQLVRSPASRQAATLLETSECAPLPATNENDVPESRISAQPASPQLPRGAAAGGGQAGQHETSTLDHHHDDNDNDNDNDQAGENKKKPSIAKIANSLHARSSSSLSSAASFAEEQKHGSVGSLGRSQTATELANAATTTTIDVNDEDADGQLKQANARATTTPRAMGQRHQPPPRPNGQLEARKTGRRQLERMARSVSSGGNSVGVPRHRRNIVNANLIGQSTTSGGQPNARSMYNHEHEDYKFSEYDDLFLSDDFRRLELQGELAPAQWLLSPTARVKRWSNGQEQQQLEGPGIHGNERALAAPKAGALTLDKAAQVRTIYFGGFFPWLADEQIQSSHETGTGGNRPHQQRQRGGGGERGRKLAGASRSESHSSRAPDTEAKGANEDELVRAAGGSHRTVKKVGNNKQQRRNQDKSTPPPLLPTPLTDNGNQDINNQTRPRSEFTSQQQQQLAAGTTTGTQYTNSQTRHQLGKFISPAVRLALDHINTNQTILSAYKLEVVPRDTQCNATISLKQFFDMVYEEPKKMLLYGDACRVSTDPIAKASYFFDLIQISYADTDPIYTIENYPNFFRVVPSENALSLARIPFIRHFNWTRVGTIYQNLPRYSLPHSKLLTDLERFKIVIKQSVSLPGSVDGLQDRDLGDELRKLKEKDVRIILGNFDEEWALLLFCEAFRERMTGRKYQWLLTGFSESKLWHYYESKGSNCTRQELLVAMDGYIITDITPVTRSQHRTISGLMAHEYLDEYRRRAREMNISIGENKFYGYVYDGIWAIALALNRVDAWLRHYSRLAREGKVRLRPEVANISSLLDFEYHQPIWVELIREALEATRFEGVTGTVSFHKNERPGLITFSQFQAYRGMNEVIIGSYDALIDQLDLNVGFPIIWRGSLPPIDYTIERITPFRINRTLFVIISIMALLGIVLACVFLFVNIKFRDQRYIKMSSPYLNNLIIIGCILTFTSVIILGLDSGLTSEYNFPYICNARAWVLMAGFTLAFGSMFSKTFRVHSIFTNIKLHKKVIKDYKLFMVVFILLTFDVCILIVWQYYDPFYRETNNGTSIQDPDNEDVIIVPEMEHCQSKRMTIFLSVIYVYKGLLMAFGCFLAWETRHVSIPALNDSKYIGLSVYNVVIMCVIGASLSFILRDQQDASFVIISIFIIFCSTTTLCLVFVPKVRMLIELKQNPRAGDHRVRATLKTFKKNYHDEALAANCRDIHGNLIGRGNYGMNLNDRIKLLADENGKQRSSLKEKTFELEALTSKYRKIQSMVQAGQYLQAVNTSASPSALTATGAATATCLAPGGGTSTQLHGVSGGGRPGSASPALMGASSSMLFTSGGPGGGSGGLTTVTNTTSNTNTGSQATAATLGAQTTTVLLTSRSPTRERVSFSAMHDELPVGTGSCNVPEGGALAGSDHTDAGGGGGLRSSPMMSSVTQITNTTTTSSTTNNTTDLTGDLSSARALISTATTSGSATSGGVGGAGSLGCGRQCLKVTPREDLHHLDGCADLGERVQAISKQVAASKQATSKSARFGDGAGGKQSRRRAFTSQDDLDLFTILSYGKVISPPPAVGGRGNTNEADSKRRRLGQWLEGPFSMLVLRQTNCDSAAAGGEGAGQQVAGVNQRRQAANNLLRFSSFRKQTSQQDSRGALAPALKATHHALGGGRARERLPRTLSMIEYLGLNDFELIARRHDKILRNRRRTMMMTTSCRQLSCCPSCSCCLMAAQQLKQQPVVGNRVTCVRRMSNHHPHNQPRHARQHMQMSDGNLGTMLSGDSSEPLNGDSEDYLQTTSLISCSTCCSLASQTYASHSELYHYDDDDDDDDDGGDQVGDSRSTTSTRSSSITGGRRGLRRASGGGRHHIAAAGGDSSSRTISSSMSESSSAIVIAGTGGERYIPDECQSEAAVAAGNRESQSSSLLTLNQTGGSCHHVQHLHGGHHIVHPMHHDDDDDDDDQAMQLQRQQHRRHRHHLSSEAISSSHSNSSTSHATQIVTTSEQRDSKPTTTAAHRPTSQELQLGSLCTSGVLYGAPAMKDDANDAAAHVALDSASEPRASTSGGEPTASTLSPLSQTTTANDDLNEDNMRAPEGDNDDDDDQQATLSIKCDILEEL